MNATAYLNSRVVSAPASASRLLLDRPLTSALPTRFTGLTAADERASFLEGAVQLVLVLCLAASFLACGLHVSAGPNHSSPSCPAATSMADAVAKPAPAAPRNL